MHVVSHLNNLSSATNGYNHSVVSILFKVDDSNTSAIEKNAFFEKVCAQIGEGKNKDRAVEMEVNLASIFKLLPKNNTFWYYEGSLTTPPCGEWVNWYVSKKVLPISRAQLQKFKSLWVTDAFTPMMKTGYKNSSDMTEPIHQGNNRNIQPLNPVNSSNSSQTTDRRYIYAGQYEIAFVTFTAGESDTFPAGKYILIAIGGALALAIILWFGWHCKQMMFHKDQISNKHHVMGAGAGHSQVEDPDLVEMKTIPRREGRCGEGEGRHGTLDRPHSGL